MRLLVQLRPGLRGVIFGQEAPARLRALLDKLVDEGSAAEGGQMKSGPGRYFIDIKRPKSKASA